MSKKTHEGKLTARLPRSLGKKVRGWIGEIGDDYRETGRRLGIEDLIAAVLIEYMDRPEEERKDVLARRLPELVELMRNEPANGSEPGGAIGPATGTIVDSQGAGVADVTQPIRKPQSRRHDHAVPAMHRP